MLVGVPKEVKDREYRVGLSPASVRELVAHGHSVLVETHAASRIGFTDEAYKDAGAHMAASAEEVFERAQMVVKVKEPQPFECRRLRPSQVLFTYLHLAPDPEQATLLKESGCVAIAYETVTDVSGHLPLLAPMSEIAGRLSVQAGASHLEMASGGRGVLIGGAPGVEKGQVVIVGGGAAGTQAARIALGMGARVTLLETSLQRIRALDDLFMGSLSLVTSNVYTLESNITEADLLICAVLVPGAKAPKLIHRDHLKSMKPGSVVVDISIDQGGCLDTSRPTTHTDPTYIEEEVVHYCVANMPGAVARTSTLSLNNATLPFVLALADKGHKQALKEDPYLKEGLNVYEGSITHRAVATALGDKYVSPESLL